MTTNPDQVAASAIQSILDGASDRGTDILFGALEVATPDERFALVCAIADEGLRPVRDAQGCGGAILDVRVTREPSSEAEAYMLWAAQFMAATFNLNGVVTRALWASVDRPGSAIGALTYMAAQNIRNAPPRHTH
ncbi:hypothetical protein ACIQXD_29490 [Streptomyces uncialis]|uniref:hypothetical protein n=1 Tax=Streptomyces uncialis TaxID=1048205 RepID=UPI003820D0E8